MSEQSSGGGHGREKRSGKTPEPVRLENKLIKKKKGKK